MINDRLKDIPLNKGINKEIKKVQRRKNRIYV